jgi:segregation and condensation protein A
VIAATLLLMKARSLLPRPEDELEMLEDTETAREFLTERLIEYKKFSNAAEWLADLYGDYGWYLHRMRELEEDYSSLYPDPFSGVSIGNLPEALIELLINRLNDTVDTEYIAPIKVSIAEHIGRVRKYLARSREGTFSELVAECRSKLDVIATFLAVLELYKKGELSLSQRRPFGDIKIVMSEGKENSAA